MRSWHGTSAIVCLASIFHVSPDSTRGDVTFYYAIGNSPGGDAEFRAAMSGPVTRYNMENLPTTIDRLSPEVDVNLLFDDETLASATVARFSSSIINSRGHPDTCYTRVLLNNPGARAKFEFTFTQPVEGFGIWIFEDACAFFQNYRLHVIERDGSRHTSAILDDVSAGNCWHVEGFLGAASTTGIVRAIVEQLDASGNTYTQTYEVDNVQVGPPVVLCAGDIDGDGETGLLDLAFLLANFGASVPAGTLGDLNGDGLVDLSDLAVLLSEFGCTTA